MESGFMAALRLWLGQVRIYPMMERFQQVAVIGILFALLWIAWEIRGLRDEPGISGRIEAKCNFGNYPLNVHIEK